MIYEVINMREQYELFCTYIYIKLGDNYIYIKLRDNYIYKIRR